jgi:hypothetical protein
MGEEEVRMRIMSDTEIRQLLADGESEQQVIDLIRRETGVSSDLVAFQIIERAKHGPDALDDVVERGEEARR